MSHTLAALIRNGHINVLEYGYGFLLTCVKELRESGEDKLKMAALAVRVSGVDQKEWKKFMNVKDAPKKKMTKNDHAANMAAVRGLK